MCLRCIHVGALGACGAHRGQKWAWGPLELESWAVLAVMWVLGT